MKTIPNIIGLKLSAKKVKTIKYKKISPSFALVENKEISL